MGTLQTPLFEILIRPNVIFFAGEVSEIQLIDLDTLESTVVFRQLREEGSWMHVPLGPITFCRDGTHVAYLRNSTLSEKELAKVGEDEDGRPHFGGLVPTAVLEVRQVDDPSVVVGSIGLAHCSSGQHGHDVIMEMEQGQGLVVQVVDEEEGQLNMWHAPWEVLEGEWTVRPPRTTTRTSLRELRPRHHPVGPNTPEVIEDPRQFFESAVDGLVHPRLCASPLPRKTPPSVMFTFPPVPASTNVVPALTGQGPGSPQSLSVPPAPPTSVATYIPPHHQGVGWACLSTTIHPVKPYDPWDIVQVFFGLPWSGADASGSANMAVGSLLTSARSGRKRKREGDDSGKGSDGLPAHHARALPELQWAGGGEQSQTSEASDLDRSWLDAFPSNMCVAGLRGEQIVAVCFVGSWGLLLLSANFRVTLWRFCEVPPPQSY